MIRTFVVSNIVGFVAGALGWAVALIVVGLVPESTISDLRVGWTGLLIASIAAAAVAIVVAMRRFIEPMVALAGAAVPAVFLWDVREIPSIGNQGYAHGTPPYYWAVVTLMGGIFFVLLIGLRVARISSGRS